MGIIMLLEKVKNGEVVLPNIQRSFVWKEDQIIRLMDSIIRGYPIGIILMWRTYEDIQYRRFMNVIQEESEFPYVRNADKNEKETGLQVVLDGQQRLQSLYIALYGQYIKGRYLYFEVLSGQEKENSAEIKYNFKFLREDDAEKLNKESELKFYDEKNNDTSTSHEKWYYVKTSELIAMDDKSKSTLKSNLRKKLKLDDDEEVVLDANINALLNNLIKDENILKESVLDGGLTREAEGRKTLADILEVFVRINSRGTRLTKSDLIFSMLKLDWKSSSVDIPTFTKKVNSKTNLKIDNDFVIKCLFTVSGVGTSNQVNKLRNKENLNKIEKVFKPCCDAIERSLDFVQKECWISSNKVLKSKNILVPFVYYMFKVPSKDITKDDFKYLRQFFYIASFKKLFERRGEVEIRRFVKDCLEVEFKKGNYRFSFERGLEFIDSIKEITKYIGINEELLKDSLPLVLNLIKPNIKALNPNNEFENDHIFSKAYLKAKKVKDNEINSYANYWYLPKIENIIKRDKDPKKFFDDNNITKEDLEKWLINYDLLQGSKFRKFLKDRKERINDFISEKLGLPLADVQP